MSGVELTVGGWFATSIIRNVMDTARSILGSNNALQSKTAEMLTSLENSLPRIQATIEEASKRPITNRGLLKWLDNLKNAAYEVKDVLDDIEAERFRESSKRKDKVTKFIYSSGKFVKTLFFSDKKLKGLKSAIDKFTTISTGIGDFINFLQQNPNANTEHTSTNRRETCSYLEPNTKIFGRDIEICSILDIILNQLCFPQEKSEEREVKGNTSEDGREDDDQDIGNIKSSVDELSLGKTKYEEESCSVLESDESDESDESNDDVRIRLVERGHPRKVKSRCRKERCSKDESHDGRKISVVNGNTSKVGEQDFVRTRNWKLPVLPICGLGGVGKTTIAQMVYNRDIMTEVFNLKAWVYVPENFDRKKIMFEIVRNLLGKTISPDMSLFEIKCKLEQTIENKKYFLVLDDVHDGIESIWSELYSVLGNCAPGSFVLVTTQSERVARTIENMSIIITLGVLEPEWFDLLFKSYAFGDLFYFDPESGISWISYENCVARAQLFNLDEEKLTALQSIATNIAKKLHGLPLAGRVIGKMLYANMDEEYWKKILISDWWDDESTCKEILASLSIGYRDLDNGLKQCFKFCSIFPKHYEFDRNTLVQMWMAHDDDFIQHNEGEVFKMHVKEIRLEDVGGDRFDTLVERSFFQATVSDGKYVMHDLIRELAIAVSEEQEFYHVKSLKNAIPSITRHMGINCDGSSGGEISPIYTKPRTVILFGNWENCNHKSIRNIFAKSNSLHLLDLSYTGIRKIEKYRYPFRGINEAIINAICELPHLRFVDLSFSGVDFIPDKFCELYHLQVLDVRGCMFEKLPKGMNKLINLRHLYGSAVSLVSGIGKLTNLQELEVFHVVNTEGHRITELRDMNEIRGHLILANLQNVSSEKEAVESHLAKKKYLKNLELKFNYQYWNQPAVELEVLEALKPCPSIEMLTIEGCEGEYLPHWMRSTLNEFSDLKSIRLSGCHQLTTLPAFGELPSLEVLHLGCLGSIEMVGDNFYGSSNVVFPSLRELTFANLKRWNVWSDVPAGKKSFPHLKKIDIWLCQELKEIPTNFSASLMLELKFHFCLELANIAIILLGTPSLTHLSISSCCKNLSIYCTALRFLEVMSLSDVADLCFFGGLKYLVNLRRLIISGDGKILELPVVGQDDGEISQENQAQCLQFLTYLHLGRSYGNIQGFSAVGRLPLLRTLFISKSPGTEYTMKEESWFLQLTSLEELTFYKCYLLRHLPSTLALLSSLKKLTIASCETISPLPEDRLPQTLIHLLIS